MEEKELKGINGVGMLILVLLGYVLSVIIFVIGIMVVVASEAYMLARGTAVIGGSLIVLSVIILILAFIGSFGFHTIKPNEAAVFTYFGEYKGVIKKAGFYFLNPFIREYNPLLKVDFEANAQAKNTNAAAISVSKKISTKVMTLSNQKQKINDKMGNPIIIGANVIWCVANPTKAVFSVDNYKEFLSIQCDSTIRNIARLYPYDTVSEESDEKTLRGSSREIAESMQQELQERVKEAGLEVKEVRITHLAYSDEIAAAMLQRQQAEAIIAARQKIVEGAVSMVKMAIDELSEEEVVVLDEERKAAMVSNLLVVLCGNKDAQPIVNSGSIY